MWYCRQSETQTKTDQNNKDIAKDDKGFPQRSEKRGWRARHNKWRKQNAMFNSSVDTKNGSVTFGRSPTLSDRYGIDV